MFIERSNTNAENEDKGTQTTLDHFGLYKEYRDKYEELLEDYDNHKITVQKLEKKLTKSKFKEGSRATHIQRLEETISGCRFEISALETTNRHFQATISKLDLEKAKMDVQLDVKENVQRLEARLKQKEEQLAWQKDEIAELRAKNEDLNRELSEEKNKRTTTQDLDTANDRISGLQEQLDWQETQLAEYMKEKETLEGKLEAQQAQNAKTQSSLSVRNAEYNRQEKALQDAQTVIEDQKTKLAQERLRAETAGRERNAAKEDVTIQKRLVEDASADSAGIKENLNECQTQLHSARNKIGTLESSLEAARRDYANAVDEKAAIMAEMSKLKADNSSFNPDLTRFFDIQDGVSGGEDNNFARSESPLAAHGIPGYNSADSDSGEENESRSEGDARNRLEIEEELERLAAENATLNAEKEQLEKVTKGPDIIRYVERVLLVDLHSKNALKCWFSTEVDMFWLILQTLWLVQLYDFFFTSPLVAVEGDVSTVLGGPKSRRNGDEESTGENENISGIDDSGTQNAAQVNLQTTNTDNSGANNHTYPDSHSPTAPSSPGDLPPVFTPTAERGNTSIHTPLPTSTPNDLQLPKYKRTRGDPTSPFTGRVPSVKWTIINFFLHLVAYMYIFSSYVERSFWLAANEQTRSFYVDWFTPHGGRGYMLYPFHDSVWHVDPWFTRADIWVYWHIVEPFWSFFQYDGIYVMPG